MSKKPYPHLFAPLQLGRLHLRNRIIAPPHAAMLGNLLGTESEADRYIAYWRAVARGGTGWVVALNGFLENHLPPGFDPTGIGSRKQGVFRNPLFVERMGRLAAAVQAEGTAASTQIIMQGGMPHGPSAGLSGPVINSVSHALTRAEIKRFVAEYRLSAEQALAAGLDGIELHANHDDLIEWFLSPLTNARSDGYGGSFDRRMAFLGEILAEIRAGVGPALTIGVRLNMAEAEPGGYDQGGGLEIAGWLQQTGMVDYLHLVMGTGWGYPSYIQTHHFGSGQWADLAGCFRRQLTLPIAYAGRVDGPAVAERILADGLADLVGVGRLHLADQGWAGKAEAGRAEDITPCIACNDCISRPLAEGLPFACTTNPTLAADERQPPDPAPVARHLLVVGGGPAGMALAVAAARRGHKVTLMERNDRLGGQILLSAKLPTQAVFLDYVAFQERRLRALGVDIQLGVQATADSIRAQAADSVALATGARPRRPAIPGADGAAVFDAVQILTGQGTPGQRIAMVVQDDHVAPLALADHLARHGAAVTMFIQTNAPAPAVSRYSAGTWLGRLSDAGVRLVCMEAVTRIDLPHIHTRHVYSQRPAIHDGFDSVVLACGGVQDDALFGLLEGTVPDLHILGDAYAPRRMVFATQQGYALGSAI